MTFIKSYVVKLYRKTGAECYRGIIYRGVFPKNIIAEYRRPTSAPSEELRKNSDISNPSDKTRFTEKRAVLNTYI